MAGAVEGIWERCRALHPLVQDTVLYAMAALFAGVTAVVALSADYRQWGAMAVGVYAAGALVCGGFFVRGRRRALAAATVGWVRRAVLLVLLVGAVLVPLFAELTWRAEALPGSHAQPEVAVIERAGDRAAQGLDPYLAHPTQVGVPPSGDQRSIDRSSFFPYLPGMVPFGIINAADLPPELRDARVVLAGFTLLVGVGALMASGASIGRRGRALQFLVVLPSGALPMVTGGDDLPVLALLLAGLVLAERRRPVLAGLVVGFAGTLKFTAWPLLALLALGVYDREDRPALVRYSLAVAAVAVPIIGAGLLAAPGAFVQNVIRFPLGLTRVHSPAASPLLGQVLVHAFHHHHVLVTACLVALGATIVVVAFARWRPTTPAGAARFAAFVMFVATVLAPATRFGYLIYPANLVVWGSLLDAMAARRAAAGQSASLRSITRKETALVGACAPLPDSAGLTDGFVTGSTTTPTSQ